MEITDAEHWLFAHPRQHNISEDFIKEHGLNETDIDLLVSKGRGYATLGDMSSLMAVINNIKEDNPQLFSTLTDFYRRLVTSDATESDLEEVTFMTLFPVSYFDGYLSLYLLSCMCP